MKLKILLTLALFIGAGMVLIDVVLSMSNQKRLLMAEMDKAEVVVMVLAHRLGQESELSPGLISQLADLAGKAGVELALADAQGDIRYHSAATGSAGPDLARVTRQALLARSPEKGTSGRSVGFLGWRYDYLLLATPVRAHQGTMLGAIGLALDLAPLYQGLFVGQRLVLFYFFLNLVVLTFLAYRRLVVLFIKPIQRLVKRAEEYRDEESFYFLSDRKGDDVTALSSSLNRMLRRINADRHKLQGMVKALEEANRSLRMAQQEVIRAEKLASVGRLSAGIAHEIGNPVGIVLGYLELLRQDNLDPDERLDFLERSIAEISRINSIIRQLLDSARTDSDEHGVVHVHALLADLCDGLRDQPLFTTMVIDLVPAAPDDRVLAVADRLRQVFLNIIMNAADALREMGGGSGGRLAIATAKVRVESGHGQGEVDTLAISFTDNGPGIAADDVESVFDPFFTTKEPGKGTGLGLSVSYMIIENAKGRIMAAQRPEGGSVFTVLLPLACPDQETQELPAP